jgi:hypothetical protein
MKVEIAQKWINALRRGEYAQIKRTLKSFSGFCCLGVLCDIHRKETGKGNWDFQSSNGEICYNIDARDYTAFLPKEVCEWAGIKEEDPRVLLSDEENPAEKNMSSLSSLNDSGTSFSEIADIIEENIETI